MPLVLEELPNTCFIIPSSVTKIVKDEKSTDLRAFFILGVSFIAVGISLMSEFGLASLGFLGCGVVFMTIGMTNKEKWEKSKKETI